MTKFPKPRKFGPACTRWLDSEIRRYEAEIAGIDPATVKVEQESFHTDTDLAKRYKVARGTIWRWSNADEQAAA